MGRPKLLLELGGKKLIRRAVEMAEAMPVEDVVVVVGPNRAEMEESLLGTRARLAENPDHLTGMASSVRAGLAALLPDIDAVVILLGDQPFQHPDTIARLVEMYEASGKPIVVPVYAGRRGNPVLFDRSLFDELSRQSGDQGGREVVAADASRVASVEFESAEHQQDLDTWADYVAARSALGEA
jgi:molybdenum cofactor cytidylyltransferase